MKIKIFFLCFCVSSGLRATELSTLENRAACHPSDASALYNLGVGAFRAGDLNKAQAAFSTLKLWCAEKKIPKERCIEIFYNAGNTEYKLNNYQDALASFESVLAYDPAHENARQKRDFIKQLLEQKKQEQQQKQDQQNQQDQKKNEQNQDKQDQNKQDQQQDQKQQQDQQKQEQQKQNEQDQKQKQEQQGQQDQQKQEQAGRQHAEEDKKEPLTEKQKKLVELAERLDNQAQEQIVRQQAGMRTRGGQHEW